MLASSGADEVFYTPFEYVERRARLVLVGITPGPTQLEMAYTKAQELLRNGGAESDVLRAVKAHAAFGGAMRGNLIRMLRHFGLGALLGIRDEADLWGTSSHILHSTSVVPHAAFRGGKMFNGSFADIQRSPAFSACFERDFVSELALLPHDAVFVALGSTPLAALDQCVDRGLLAAERVLGSFAHPSKNGGSQVDIFLGERDPSTLDSADPVRHRVTRLLTEAKRMRAALERLAGAGASASVSSGARTVPLSAVTTQANVVPAFTTERTRGARPAAAPQVDAGLNRGLYAVVSRGKAKGAILRPHVHSDGCYVVSPTKYEADYFRVPAERGVEEYLKRGLSLRMSASGISPSLITPASIRGRGD